ncbi:helix-turn-helix domain-containing protein [Bailinhaonella thermotolerans]|uniref:XRE family transcriptional regulator n=1 Tax=Bailinhaonella thermotolerans TaxID=1070861 RepID=A0A3A4AZX9_9ACTN|nr:helix-turn-helix transcriptional regulator [Bailinhaonella thermotolerans]RJL34139.1 XRE family transcriptional regulator [Bailinhaonella thermotolerans]
MSARTSPTARRRRLAAELRRLRKGAGYTREQVARHVGCAPVTISRIESAQSGARPGEVALMLDLYGVPADQREALLSMARDARKRGWWHQYGRAVPDWFQVYVGLEAEAWAISSYEPEVVPGLLQTEDYARALMRADPAGATEGEIERRVAVRLGRQALLDREDALRLRVVLGEAALRRPAGGPATMREQLRRLIDLSYRENVSLSVLPFAAGAPSAVHGGFHILLFPDAADPDIVYVEYRTGSLYLEKQSDLDTYTLMFDHLGSRALTPDESRSFITDVLKELSE